MKFRVSTDAIKTRDLIESEDSLKLAIKLMSKFAIDESGNSIPQEEAYEMLLDLTLEEQQKTSEAFTNAIIPNLKGRRS